MSVETHVFVLIGLGSLSAFSIVLLVLMASMWRAANKREESMIERHRQDKRGWEARDRDAWHFVDQLTREVAELRGALHMRRAKKP